MNSPTQLSSCVAFEQGINLGDWRLTTVSDDIAEVIAMNAISKTAIAPPLPITAIAAYGILFISLALL